MLEEYTEAIILATTSALGTFVAFRVELLGAYAVSNS